MHILWTLTDRREGIFHNILQGNPVGRHGRSPRAPVESSASAPASGHRAVVASAMGLTVVPEQLPQLPEWCFDECQGVLALDIADIPNP